jgi:hypothetical protein
MRKQIAVAIRKIQAVVKDVSTAEKEKELDEFMGSLEESTHPEAADFAILLQYYQLPVFAGA